MALLRLIALLAAVLALAGARGASAPVVAHQPATLQADSAAAPAVEAAAAPAGAQTHVGPPALVGVAAVPLLRIPAPRVLEVAFARPTSVKLKHAHASQCSGLSPPGRAV